MTRLRVTQHNILWLLIENINNNNLPLLPALSLQYGVCNIVQWVWGDEMFITCPRVINKYLRAESDKWWWWWHGNMVTSSQLFYSLLMDQTCQMKFSRDHNKRWHLHSQPSFLQHVPAWLALHIKHIWSVKCLERWQNPSFIVKCVSFEYFILTTLSSEKCNSEKR